MVGVVVPLDERCQIVHVIGSRHDEERCSRIAGVIWQDKVELLERVGLSAPLVYDLK